ncbi:ABC transporter permease [Actinokineospora bangkokensis]|uniref:Nitrate ABC transporter permease n=1 Tax=Actinokineospora bangkokensis TaxID=1193682 RepID=A0A1Q9LKV5_9PSEU|nr:ABC transporter permease [Actinokineospora bangkokensis]OLR92650.1 nitrate ABC transporter permease [Actinokineospora bangkokensis]
MRDGLLRLLGAACVLLVWEAAGRSGVFLDGYLPPPSEVLPRVVALLGDGGFLLGVVATVLSWAIGLLIAVAIGVPLGLLLGSSATARAASRSVVEFLRPIPTVAMVPLAVVAVGGGPGTKIGLTAFAALWPVLFATTYAFEEVEPLLVETARSFGLGRAAVLARVALPSVAPFVLTGLRLSAAIGLSVLIGVEMLTGTSGGIGEFILVAASGVTRMDQVLAGVVVAGLLGYLINEGLERAQRRWLGWGAREVRPR